MWQMMALQAGQNLVGGLLDAEEQKRKNRALSRSQDIMRSNLNRLVEERKSISNYRRGEAQQFLNDYIVTMDPERSRAIAGMYSTGQERFRAEMQSNEQLQDQVNANIANLESQKQSPKSWLELAAGTALGAGAGYATHLGQEAFKDALSPYKQMSGNDIMDLGGSNIGGGGYGRT